MTDRNECIVTGTIVNTPRFGKTKNNGSMARFTVSTAHPEPSKAHDYLLVSAWGDAADMLQGEFHENDRITVYGSVRTSSYEDQEGKRRWITRINADSIEHPMEEADEGESSV